MELEMMTQEKLDHLRMRLETACLGGDVDSKIVAELLEDYIALKAEMARQEEVKA
jgi:hypothetical protein